MVLKVTAASTIVGAVLARSGEGLRCPCARTAVRIGYVQEAFGIVLVVVVVLAAIVAVIAIAGSGSVYDQIGRGGLSLRDRSDRPARAPAPRVAAGERDEEIRQMLEARNARRLRQGREPLDVDAELAALRRPAVDPGLALEIRQVVTARNARRVRQGKEPLDVEAEVARRLRELAD
jgi:hypothetical protein